jgi:hypothetical protein
MKFSPSGTETTNHFWSLVLSEESTKVLIPVGLRAIAFMEGEKEGAIVGLDGAIEGNAVE